jgi:hypothetical protein
VAIGDYDYLLNSPDRGLTPVRAQTKFKGSIMNAAQSSNFKSHIITLLMALMILTFSAPAQAYFYSGGDWGGNDLTLLNGDSLSGTFSNVGQFYIPTGALVSGSTANLVVNASTTRIDGSLTGVPVTGYNLEIYSLTNLILNGSISSWKNIWLAANQNILFSETSSISTLDGGSLSAVVPISTPLSIPTPIPAAAWLFGSGLLGLIGIRRKRT